MLAKAFGSNAIPSLATGTPTSLTFTLTNNSPYFALTGVGFTDNLAPLGMTVATPNGLASTCTGAVVTVAAGSSSISVMGAALAPASTCTITVYVVGNTPGSFTNVTTPVTSNEAGPGNTGSATINIGPKTGKAV